MPLNLRLLQLAQALLWGQLLISGQLQPVAALGIPMLLALSLGPNWMQARRRLLALTLLVLTAWTVTAPLLERSSWQLSLGNLVWLMGGLKLLESNTPASHRRACLVLLIGIGLAGSLSHTLAASLVQGASALCCMGSLLYLEAGPQPLKGLLRRCLMMVGVLLPVVIAAFLLLPRLPVLWSLPGGAGLGQSGLSTELRPGDIAQLVLQKGIAARVQFSGAPPPPQERYWRVLVHRRFDGEVWSQGPPPAFVSTQPRPMGPMRERWLVEPTPLRWRPWSGEGLPTDPALKLSSTGGLWAGTSLNERQLYGLGASGDGISWRSQMPTAWDLQLPQGSNPKLEALAQRWRAQSDDPAALVALARRWYVSQGFRYSLEPGQLPGTAPLDAFLFERRLGFCEHFAASFSAFMRAAGVPARVVVGYQGGSWETPLAGAPYLLLEQSNAHAWSEVWLPERGWVTVDPTGWVVPERVRLSLASSLNARDRQRLSAGAPPRWLQGLASQWQGLDTRWQLWVMQFDSIQQRQLLPGWLMGDWQGVIALLSLALCLGGSLTLMLWLERYRDTTDPARQALNRCLRELKALSLEARPGESLQQLLRRACQQHPPLETPLDELLNLYNQYRFGRQPLPWSHLRIELRALRPRLRAFGRRPTA